MEKTKLLLLTAATAALTTPLSLSWIFRMHTWGSTGPKPSSRLQPPFPPSPPLFSPPLPPSHPPLASFYNLISECVLQSYVVSYLPFVTSTRLKLQMNQVPLYSHASARDVGSFRRGVVTNKSAFLSRLPPIIANAFVHQDKPHSMSAC